MEGLSERDQDRHASAELRQRLLQEAVYGVLVERLDHNRLGPGQPRAPADLAHQLRVDDLRAGGWQVVGPRKESDGLTWVRASKPFADPAEAERIVADLSGPTGPFHSFRAHGRLRNPPQLSRIASKTSRTSFASSCET